MARLRTGCAGEHAWHVMFATGHPTRAVPACCHAIPPLTVLPTLARAIAKRGRSVTKRVVVVEPRVRTSDLLHAIRSCGLPPPIRQSTRRLGCPWGTVVTAVDRLSRPRDDPSASPCFLLQRRGGPPPITVNPPHTDMLPPSAVGGGPGAKRAGAPTSRMAPAVKTEHWSDVRTLRTCGAARAGGRGRTRR
jgi:hypothetical protein